jgi:hypothetical protein
MTDLGPELAHLYARVLVAVARADHEISFEEGLRLEQRINARCREPIAIDDVLLSAPIDPSELARVLVGDGPFRGSPVHPVELARALVADGVAILLAKGHATDNEARSLWRYASALGLTGDDFRALTEAASKWWPSTV